MPWPKKRPRAAVAAASAEVAAVRARAMAEAACATAPRRAQPLPLPAAPRACTTPAACEGRCDRRHGLPRNSPTIATAPPSTAGACAAPWRSAAPSGPAARFRCGSSRPIRPPTRQRRRRAAAAPCARANAGTTRSSGAAADEAPEPRPRARARAATLDRVEVTRLAPAPHRPAGAGFRRCPAGGRRMAGARAHALWPGRRRRAAQSLLLFVKDHPERTRPGRPGTPAGRMSDTLAAPRHALLEVKHSRFLAQAAPATSPEAALAFLAQVADPRRDAQLLGLPHRRRIPLQR